MVNWLKTHDKIKPESKQPNTDNSVKPKSTLNKSSKFKPRTAPSTGKKSGNIGIYSVSPSETVVDVSAKKTNSSRERKCLFCDQEHVTYKCNAYPNFDTRIKRLQELHRCTKCMGSHDPSKCVVHLRLCSRCNKGMHHYALCRKTSQSTTPREDFMNSPTVQYCKVHQEINVLATESGNNTTLPKAQLKLINRKYRVNTRGLFNQGSQKTFITQQLVEQLKLKPAKRVKLSISGFLTNSGPREYQVVKILVRLGSSTNSILAAVVDKLPSDLQVTGIVHTAKYLRRNLMRLAYHKINSDSLIDVGILIVADYYYRFINGCTRQLGMNLLSSAGGKLLTGPVLFQQKSVSTNKQPNNSIVA
ncbi:uncharacterized protein [Procambarus clarkii]|uniref:uncharacterized protein n=1 Tax=Procambarus clarkii TaxID=6728 RepID=UPI003743FE65